MLAGRQSKIHIGGLLTAQDWVYFFPAVSVFLLVAFFFARHVIGSDQGTSDMQKFAVAIKGGAETFLKRRYKSIAALLGLAGSFGLFLGAIIGVIAAFLVQAALVKAVQDVRDGRADLNLGETVSAVLPVVCTSVSKSKARPSTDAQRTT